MLWIIKKGEARARSDTHEQLMEVDAKGSKKSKRTGGSGSAGDGDTSLTTITIALSKLVLQQGDTIRALVSSVWDFRLCEPDHEAATAAVEQNKLYQQVVEEQGSGHGKGSPHIQASWAFFNVLAETPGLDPKQKLILQALCHLPEAISQEDYGEIIPYFSAQPAFVKDKKESPKIKISFLFHQLADSPFQKPTVRQQLAQSVTSETMQSFRPAAVREAAIMALTFTKCKGSAGKPPRGELERVVQRHLKSLQRKEPGSTA